LTDLFGIESDAKSIQTLNDVKKKYKIGIFLLDIVQHLQTQAPRNAM